MNAPATFPPGTLGCPCKVAVCLDTGDWRILGTARTYTGAAAIETPADATGPNWVTFTTVEGLAKELATDTYEIGYFEGPTVPMEDRL